MEKLTKIDFIFCILCLLPLSSSKMAKQNFEFSKTYLAYIEMSKPDYANQDERYMQDMVNDCFLPRPAPPAAERRVKGLLDSLTELQLWENKNKNTVSEHNRTAKQEDINALQPSKLGDGARCRAEEARQRAGEATNQLNETQKKIDAIIADINTHFACAV